MGWYCVLVKFNIWSFFEGCVGSCECCSIIYWWIYLFLSDFFDYCEKEYVMINCWNIIEVVLIEDNMLKVNEVDYSLSLYCVCCIVFLFSLC